MSIALVLLLFAITACRAHAEDSDLADLFKSMAVDGTIVISSLDGAQTFVHNDERAATRYLPASTFKIPNTLIALEERAVADEKEIIKWDAEERWIAAWNQDQSLETAFPSSCVWFYQELARRVGKEKYESYLDRMQYGNGEAGPEATTFWLEGDLRISAIEQIAVLKRIYRREYPFRQSSYEILRKLMVVEPTPAYIIRAKTGWAHRVTPEVGWFVGYVESGDSVWFFATNIEIAKPEELRFRQEVTLEALKRKGIIEKAQ